MFRPGELICVAIHISDSDPNLQWWDKTQFIVTLSRTKILIIKIFVGNKNDTIKALSRLICQKNYYIEYMVNIIDLVTVNITNYDRNNSTSRTIYQPKTNHFVSVTYHYQIATQDLFIFNVNQKSKFHIYWLKNLR